jgi:hypothetical protein
LESACTATVKAGAASRRGIGNVEGNPNEKSSSDN